MNDNCTCTMFFIAQCSNLTLFQKPNTIIIFFLFLQKPQEEVQASSPPMIENP